MKKGIVAAQWLWGIGVALGGFFMLGTWMTATSAPQEASGMSQAMAIMVFFYVMGRSSELNMHRRLKEDRDEDEYRKSQKIMAKERVEAVKESKRLARLEKKKG